MFAPVVFYTNGTNGSLQSDGAALPTPMPAGLYVLTMQVTAGNAAGLPAVYDGLGFDPAHPNGWVMYNPTLA